MTPTEILNHAMPDHGNMDWPQAEHLTALAKGNYLTRTRREDEYEAEYGDRNPDWMAIMAARAGLVEADGVVRPA